jgi:hypothetical protein
MRFFVSPTPGSSASNLRPKTTTVSELMDRIDENPWFYADESIAYLQLKPARKHFDEVLTRLDLANSGSKRTAHLRHTFETRKAGVNPQRETRP